MARRPPRREKQEPPQIALPEGGRDLSRLLADAFKEIRLRAGYKNQTLWAEAISVSQSWVSAVEAHAEGFESVQRIADGLALAGIDPLELLRVALAHAELSEEEAELYSRLSAATPAQRGGVLAMLRVFAGPTSGVATASR